MELDDVLLFLNQWKDLVDPFSLESLVLTKPGVDSSNEVFLDYLKFSTSFSLYEEFNLALAELKVDVREGDLRERMSC
ncbi:hypothetical protein P9112_009716 [Eukaryota sp. TZLM1-RC]